MTRDDVRRKLVLLMTVRVVVSTLLLGAGILVQLRSAEIGRPSAFYALIGLTYGLTVAYAVALRVVGERRWLIDLQLTVDALVVSAFILVTGGVTSYFSSLYVLPIIAASSLQVRRGGLLVAGVSAATYTLLVGCQYLVLQGLLDWSWLVAGQTLVMPLPRVALFTVGINDVGMLAVALLSGSLAERLRHADESLVEASQEIANLQALSQHIIDSLTMGVVTTDYQGRVLTFNPTAETITRHRAGTIVGQSVHDLLQLPPAFSAALQASLETTSSQRADFRYRTGDGQEIDIGLSATHLITAGRRSGFLFTFQDVTAIRKLERDARMQQRLAAVGEMAAGIAHEIRNPLAAMSGSIQLLRKDLDLSAEQGQLMDIVLRESERLNNTIRSFLAYARPQRFAVMRIDVRRVMNDTAMLLRNSAEAREGHRIEVEVPPDEAWFEADEGQIRQIVWNLATNGLRAMPSGGRLRLRATAPPERPGDVILSVSDEGVGIPQEELDSIFQPFRGTFAKGSGLGMAIVHRIVSDYNGEIQVTSRLGAGTTVEVRLPARGAAAVA
jgi:two-component system, NtrC family, sensor histidine kinase PilS